MSSWGVEVVFGSETNQFREFTRSSSFAVYPNLPIRPVVLGSEERSSAGIARSCDKTCSFPAVDKP